MPALQSAAQSMREPVPWLRLVVEALSEERGSRRVLDAKLAGSWSLTQISCHVIKRLLAFTTIPKLGVKER